ncbi:MAG: leucine-rich repeat protein [Clostridia bacterium]|nr:leucine-rich repeat protein [Clostridia bacterium]
MYNRKTIYVIVCLLLAMVLLTACSYGNREKTVDSSVNRYSLNLKESMYELTGEYLSGDQLYSTANELDENGVYIIEIEGKSIVDMYLEQESVETITDFALECNRNGEGDLIDAQQRAVMVQMEAQGIEYELRSSIKVIANAFSVETTLRNAIAIMGLDGVKDVIVSEEYTTSATTGAEEYITEDDEFMGDSRELLNVDGLEEAGYDYDGNGMVVAIIDSGFLLNHEVFSTNMPTVLSVKQSDIDEVLSLTSAYTIANDPSYTASSFYTNEKVPFSFDYANRDLVVRPSMSSVMRYSGAHGTHVAGLAVGNSATFKGTAPNAQLIALKVFPDTSAGAQMDVILTALNDAVLLNVDAINMSLGSAAGFSSYTDDYTASIYKKIGKLGITVTCSAGNAYASSIATNTANLAYSSNPDYATVSSAASYAECLAVASMNAIEAAKKCLIYDGNKCVYGTAVDLDTNAYDSLGILLGEEQKKDIQYVTIPNAGDVSDYEGIDVVGRVALVKRGGLSFEQKMLNAEAAGAVAIVIYNNTVSYGVINAQMASMSIPVFTIKAEVGEDMAAKGSGVITFDKEAVITKLMSEFSSWGALSDLTLKPDITAPGGAIYSCIHNISSQTNVYGYMSGTSMASPNLDGVVLILKQYIRSVYPEVVGSEMNKLVYRLLMSTADILNDEYGIAYSPRKQGAGLANIVDAVSAEAYLYVVGENMPKIELGDDRDKYGVYTMNFSLVNLSDEGRVYDLSVLAMTDKASEDGVYTEQRGKLLTDAARKYYVNGALAENGRVSVAGNSEVKIKVILTLTEEEKNYLDVNYVNGIYVEGYVCLTGEDLVGLNIPFLAFYGDWGDAEYFDKSIYDEEPADVAQSFPIAYKGGSYYYMGKYAYTLPEGVEAPNTSEDKVAISGLAGTYTALGGIVFGLKRNIGLLEFHIYDAITGDLIEDDSIAMIRKSYYSNGILRTQINFKIDSILEELPNNSSFIVECIAYSAYKYTEVIDTCRFVVNVDIERPTLDDLDMFVGEDGRVYMSMRVYDNHYVMDYRMYNYDASTETVGSMLTDYPIPVYGGSKNSYATYVTDVTDIVNAMEFSDMVLVIEDYALNMSLTGITVSDEIIQAAAKFIEPEVSNVNATIGVKDFMDGVKVMSVEEEGFVIEDGVLVAYNGTETEISIPASVVKIANGVFSGKAISKVVFNDTLTTIGAQAFMNCTKLTEIALPNSVTEIGTECFSGCTALTKAALSTEILDISDKAFYNCTALADVTYPTHYTRIGDSAFYKCSAITSIDLPETVKRIEANAFYSTKATAVKTLKLPSSLEYLGNYCFRYIGLSELTIPDTLTESVFEGPPSTIYAPFMYSQITKIVFPDAWTRVPDYMCYYNKKLAEIVYPTNVKQIGISSFFYCEKLDKLYIPDTIETLRDNCYAYCKGVTEIHIPEGIKALPKRLCDTSQITSITIPASVETIGHQCFHRSEKLEEVIFAENGNLSYIDTYAFAGCTSLTEFYMPNTVTECNSSFIQDCSSLKVLVLSENLTTIGGVNPFKGTAVEELVIPEKYQGYIGQLCSYMTELKRCIFKNNVYYITNSTFTSCTSLETIIFEKNVDLALALGYNLQSLTEVEFRGDINKLYGLSFGYCANLKTVTFNNVNTITGFVGQYSAIEKMIFNGNIGSIELFAFQYMEQLKEIELNGDLGSVGEFVFYSYAAVDGVNTGFVGPEYLSTPNVRWVVPESNPYLTVDEDGVLYNKDKTRLYKLAPGIVVDNYEMPDSVVIVDNGAFAGRSDIHTIKLGSQFVDIPDKAFFGMTSLTSIDISNVRSLGAYAFGNCMALESISLSDKVKTLPEGVFNGCTALTYAAAEGSISSVGAYAFEGCSKLELPEWLVNTESVGAYAFYNCPFTSIGANTMKYIGEGAFADCQYLTSFEFCSDLRELGEYAFENCPLEKIILNEGLLSVGNYSFSGCTEAKEVYIPSSLGEFLFYKTFRYCENITDVRIGEDNMYLVMQDGVLFTKDMTSLVFYSQNIDALSYVIPEGVIKVGRNAFYGNKRLTTVEFPSTLKVIGDKAFYGCTNLNVLIFNSEVAPILEALYDENHYILYANFVDYVEDMERGLILYCPNAENYYAPVWLMYFSSIYNTTEKEPEGEPKLMFGLNSIGLTDRNRAFYLSI